MVPSNRQQEAAELEKAWRWGEDSPEEEAMADPGAPVPAAEAGYLPPDMGPFSCANCLNFVADGQPCNKVADPVSSDGCCDLFASAGGGGEEEFVEDEGMEMADGNADLAGAQTASY